VYRLFRDQSLVRHGQDLDGLLSRIPASYEKRDIAGYGANAYLCHIVLAFLEKTQRKAG